MTETTSEPVVAAAPSTTYAAAAAQVPSPDQVEVRRNRGQSFLMAIGSLIAFGAVALGVMLAGGVIIHSFDPTKQLDIFAALHHRWVVGILLGLTLLWLLPPYPWAKRAIPSSSPEQPAPPAGGTEDGDAAVVAVQLNRPGGEPFPQPAENRRAPTLPLVDS